jgi:hypothetical protein
MRGMREMGGELFEQVIERLAAKSGWFTDYRYGLLWV